MRRRNFLTAAGGALCGGLARGAAAAETIAQAPANGSPANEPPAEKASSDRARRVHDDSLVIVAHDHNPIGPDVPRMLDGGVTGKVLKLLVDVDIGPDIAASAKERQGWTAKGLAALDDARRAIDADPRAMLALKADDFIQAKRQGKAAILLGVEGGKLLEGNLENLARFHSLGLRELQLRWAVPNQIVEQDTLTEFGVQVVRECQRLGLVIDLSHIPTPAFDQVIELARQPVIVSHGTAAGASPVGTDHADRKIKALASRGGVLAIHFYNTYLGANPTVDRVADQVDYIAQAAGIETAALGCDFFPTTGKWRELQLAQGTQDISWAVDHIGQLLRVTEALVERNYREEDIKKVLGGNYLRVCRAVFGG